MLGISLIPGPAKAVRFRPSLAAATVWPGRQRAGANPLASFARVRVRSPDPTPRKAANANASARPNRYLLQTHSAGPGIRPGTPDPGRRGRKLSLIKERPKDEKGMSIRSLLGSTTSARDLKMLSGMRLRIEIWGGAWARTARRGWYFFLEETERKMENKNQTQAIVARRQTIPLEVPPRVSVFRRFVQKGTDEVAPSAVERRGAGGRSGFVGGVSRHRRPLRAGGPGQGPDRGQLRQGRRPLPGQTLSRLPRQRQESRRRGPGQVQG